MKHTNKQVITYRILDSTIANADIADGTITSDKMVRGHPYTLNFRSTNVADAMTDVPLLTMDGINNSYVIPLAGSVLAIGITSNEPRSGGTLEADVTINGTKTGLSAVIGATNTIRSYTVQAKDSDVLAAGDRLGVAVTTFGTWAPTTADIIVTVWSEF